jgi:hypothetical protein
MEGNVSKFLSSGSVNFIFESLQCEKEMVTHLFESHPESLPGKAYTTTFVGCEPILHKSSALV